MPLISIVMPTYNRADTIQRAITSVRAQSWSDWELIVVDDGSTDDTTSRLGGLDPRIRLLWQENKGVTAARNTGLAAAKGELVAFLDSDDEWLPHHLALAAAFFAAHPGEHLFTSEFWEDFGIGGYVKHYRPSVGEYAPRTAKLIGSSAFDGPAPQGDPYLRFYDSCTPVGAWGRPTLEKTAYANALHYRGNIFRGWRWEFLMSMQSTVLTRAALEHTGMPDAKYKVASDYAWLAMLCRDTGRPFLLVPALLLLNSLALRQLHAARLPVARAIFPGICRDALCIIRGRIGAYAGFARRRYARCRRRTLRWVMARKILAYPSNAVNSRRSSRFRSTCGLIADVGLQKMLVLSAANAVPIPAALPASNARTEAI